MRAAHAHITSASLTLPGMAESGMSVPWWTLCVRKSKAFLHKYSMVHRLDQWPLEAFSEIGLHNCAKRRCPPNPRHEAYHHDVQIRQGWPSATRLRQTQRARRGGGAQGCQEMPPSCSLCRPLRLCAPLRPSEPCY